MMHFIAVQLSPFFNVHTIAFCEPELLLCFMLQWCAGAITDACKRIVSCVLYFESIMIVKAAMQCCLLVGHARNTAGQQGRKPFIGLYAEEINTRFFTVGNISTQVYFVKIGNKTYSW